MKACKPSMSGYTKSTAPNDFVQELAELKLQSDEWFEQLEIRGDPQNLAVWAVLTKLIERIEKCIKDSGPYSNNFNFAMNGLSRSATLLIEAIQANEERKFVPRSRFRWRPPLAMASDAALDAAHNYVAFKTSLSAWDKGKDVVEKIGERKFRFTAVGGPNHRRVNAFHKGIRPKNNLRAVRPPDMQFTPEMHTLFETAFQGCKKDGALGFKYKIPMDLLGLITETYIKRLGTLFRRDPSVNLGNYTLEQFKSFYAALMAISYVHRELCDDWSNKTHRYPLNSAVIVKERESWVDLLSGLGALTAVVVTQIIQDITSGTAKKLDLHVHPFVPLDEKSWLLGLVPHFPLHSRAEENILRMCSLVRPSAHNQASSVKEKEMLEELEQNCSSGLTAKSRIRKQGKPFIDLVLSDDRSSTVVVAELKWLRKPHGVVESVDDDERILHGLSQLNKVKEFLNKEPRWLVERGILPQPLTCYEHVYYFLVARDHFIWVDPAENYPVIEYVVFIEMLRTASDLHNGVSELLRFEWLPVDGRDFAVLYQKAEVSNVCIESETCYAL